MTRVAIGYRARLGIAHRLIKRCAMTANREPPRRQRWEEIPPDPGIVPGGIRDRAMHAVGSPKGEDKEKTHASQEYRAGLKHQLETEGVSAEALRGAISIRAVVRAPADRTSERKPNDTTRRFYLITNRRNDIPNEQHRIQAIIEKLGGARHRVPLWTLRLHVNLLKRR
jgi:hypothetical protein